MRINFTQLPKSQELKNILEKEAERDIPKTKRDIHYPDFTLVEELFNQLGVSPDIFIDEIKIQDLSDDLINKVEEKIGIISNKILKGEYEIGLLNKIFNYLSEEDNLEKADFIFVFGSFLKLRMDKAIELYKKSFSKLIVVSGSKAFYDKKEIIISEELKKYAISQGVPRENIITEIKSVSIPDNVKSTLNLLEEKGIGYKKIILVNSPYAQRRGWVHFNKFMCKTKFIRVNAESLKFGRDNWYKTESGIKLVLNEFVKMKVAVMLNTA